MVRRACVHLVIIPYSLTHERARCPDPRQRVIPASAYSSGRCSRSGVSMFALLLYCGQQITSPDWRPGPGPRRPFQSTRRGREITRPRTSAQRAGARLKVFSGITQIQARYRLDLGGHRRRDAGVAAGRFQDRKAPWRQRARSGVRRRSSVAPGGLLISGPAVRHGPGKLWPTVASCRPLSSSSDRGESRRNPISGVWPTDSDESIRSVPPPGSQPPATAGRMVTLVARSSTTAGQAAGEPHVLAVDAGHIDSKRCSASVPAASGKPQRRPSGPDAPISSVSMSSARVAPVGSRRASHRRCAGRSDGEM